MGNVVSVILPTYERADAALCAMAGLERQTLDDFEIVMVDDSESDSVYDALMFYLPEIKYIRSSPPRVGNFTVSRARNMGAANASGDLLVFIDQDVILAPDALERYAEAYERHGDNVVIAGLYDWLPALDFDTDDVRTRFDEIVEDAFGARTVAEWTFPRLPMPSEDGGMLGRDLRREIFDGTDNVTDGANACFGGNIGYPRKLFMELGGWDENLRGYGGEDIDLSLTARAHGARFLLWDAIWGVHRWHPIDSEQNGREIQANIEYIDRKHGDGAGRLCCGGGGQWLT